VASGKRDQPVPGTAVVSPFHAPFRDLARSFVARPAGARPANPAPSPKPAPARSAPPRATAAPIAPSAASSPEESDEQVLATLGQGVTRLSQLSSRVRVRRPPDLSEIEARRRDERSAELSAMARGEGFDVTYEDLHVRARAASVSRETLARLERGEFAISAHLDLHGMPFEDARRAVDAFLAEQQKKGRRCVLIVTGKGKNSPGGQGVLRERVPEWLARGPSSRRVLAFASARACDGGVGALVVLMRAGSSRKTRIDVEHGGAGPIGT
jgi:DNA-nicking Smr family endonuclease